MTRWYRGSRFRYNFDQKINQSRLKDRNHQFISKSQLILTFSIIFDIFPIKFDRFRTFQSFLSCWNQFRRDDSESDNKFELKMLIKWPFKSDSKQNLAQIRLHGMSLLKTFSPGLAAKQMTASVWPCSIFLIRSCFTFFSYSYTATTELVPAVRTRRALGQTHVRT